MIKLSKAKKYLTMGFNKIKNHLQTEIFLKTGLFLPKPLKIYYLISNKCNFKCQMCPQWKTGQQEKIVDYLSEKKVEKIIDEACRLKIKEFGISGGEPLIFKDKLLNLLKYASGKGMYTHFATNGSLLDKDFLEKYNTFGTGHVSISIDGIGKKHDELRGYPGAFIAVEKVLKLFQDNSYNNLNLKINTVLSNENLDEVIDVVKLAIKNQAMIFIQPFDPYAYGKKDIKYREDNFSLWVKKENYTKLREVIKELVDLKQKYSAFILNDVKHLEAFYEYFTNSKFYITCFAGIDQIAINPQGKVTFCKFGEYGDLKKNSLKDFLKSPSRKKVLKQSLICREGCLLGCMFRPSLKSLIFNGFKQFLKLSN
jgi:MoaA/NifB/PqqE/SkfB family radical SAM enzyme